MTLARPAEVAVSFFLGFFFIVFIVVRHAPAWGRPHLACGRLPPRPSP